MKSIAKYFLTGLGPLVLVCGFAMVPALIISYQGLSYIPQVLGSTRLIGVLGFTMAQAGISAFIAGAIGLPIAWLLAKTPLPGKRGILAISGIPFVMPPILVVLGFVAFYGRSGWLQSLFSFDGTILFTSTAVIMAHVFYNIPVFVRLVGRAWLELDRGPEAAARTLGMGPWKVFLTIDLPRLAPVIWSAAALVFLYCFTSFSLVLVLGGGPRVSTVEVEIFSLARQPGGMGLASSLALIDMLVAGCVLLVSEHLARSNPNKLGNGQFPGLLHGVPWWAYVLLGSLAIFYLGPLLSVLGLAFTHREGYLGDISLSLTSFIKAFSPSGIRAMVNSVLLASCSSFLAIVLGLQAAYLLKPGNVVGWRWLLRGIFSFPMLLSPLVLGLGFILLSQVLGLGQSWLLLILLHGVLSLPFVLGILGPAVATIPPGLVAAARTLGAPPLVVWCTVDLPLLLPRILGALAFAMALSMGEMNAVLIFAPHNVETLPLVLYRAMGSYQFSLGGVYGVLLMVFTFLAFWVTERRVAYP